MLDIELDDKVLIKASGVEGVVTGIDRYIGVKKPYEISIPGENKDEVITLWVSAAEIKLLDE